MRLRSTPDRLGYRDRELFPALEQSYQRRRAPYRYAVTVIPGCSRVRIALDYFWVPEDIRARLESLYSDYLHWWLNDSHLRKPRGWVTLPCFEDWVTLLVHRDHADWWITLLNEAAVFTYSPWQAGCYAWPTKPVPLVT